MKNTLISLALLLSVVSSAQTIGVRSLEPTQIEEVKLEVYDTTFVHLDFAKLIDNPNYYNNQKVFFSPNINEYISNNIPESLSNKFNIIKERYNTK